MSLVLKGSKAPRRDRLYPSQRRPRAERLSNLYLYLCMQSTMGWEAYGLDSGGRTNLEVQNGEQR